jgi:pyridoxine/pyridoxamine 5'-phosphate oxidase
LPLPIGTNTTHSAISDDNDTVDNNSVTGRPSSRMVLLKGVTERGFVFFTNFGIERHHQRNMILVDPMNV